MQTQDSTILCNSGTRFDLINPAIEDIKIQDIAMSLSRICRYGGHCDNFYSVAQHSILVSRIVPPHLALEGLLHDAAEAYVGDIVAPLKQFLPDYKLIEKNIEKVIALKYNLDITEAALKVVKTADLIMLLTEKRDLFDKESPQWYASIPFLKDLKPLRERINPVDSTVAMGLFIARFNQLIKERDANC